MDKTKLKNQVKKFEEHLIVDRGLAKITVEGYSRSVSIALRRMRKFCPRYPQIKPFILWMHNQEYSYNHIVNTSIAIEHYCQFKGYKVRIGRPRKPRRIIQGVLSESEVARLIQSTKNSREKAIVCLLAYLRTRVSGIRSCVISKQKISTSVEISCAF